MCTAQLLFIGRGSGPWCAHREGQRRRRDSTPTGVQEGDDGMAGPPVSDLLRGGRIHPYRHQVKEMMTFRVHRQNHL
uniref:Uncharacterized protein n=1 Tax=Arundo donax TaxID=35708 RepID=A0A0A9AW08_ARUDO